MPDLHFCWAVVSSKATKHGLLTLEDNYYPRDQPASLSLSMSLPLPDAPISSVGDNPVNLSLVGLHKVVPIKNEGLKLNHFHLVLTTLVCPSYFPYYLLQQNWKGRTKTTAIRDKVQQTLKVILLPLLAIINTIRCRGICGGGWAVGNFHWGIVTLIHSLPGQSSGGICWGKWAVCWSNSPNGRRGGA